MQGQLEPGSRKHHQADSNGNGRQGPGGGEAEAEGANQMQFALKAQVERFVAKDKEVRCAKDWEEERLDGLGGGVARHQGREGGEAEAEGRDGQLGGAVLALRSQSEDAARRPRVRAGSRLADGDSAQVRDAEAQV